MKIFIACILLFSLLLSSLSPAVVASEAADFPVIDFPTKAVSVSSEAIDTLAASIVLQHDRAEIDGTGAVWQDDALHISQSGSYLLTGALNDHAIIVDTPDDQKVTLILNGVQLSNASSCLIVLTASKNVTIHCVEGSVNILSSTLDASASQPGAYDAAIYSKEDLKFEGNGSLYIRCVGGKGVNCRDDLSIHDLSLHVIADDDGLRGKDSVVVSGGILHIQAGADGIRSNNTESADKGIITVIDGQIWIEAKQDGLQSHNTLTIAGGTVHLKTGSGAQAAQKKSNDFRRNGGGPGGWGGWQPDSRSNQAQQEETISTKGVKSSARIVISGGSLTADCQDDALHSDGSMDITGGNLLLSSGDDGVHAETALTVSNGSINVLQSYEGLESALITITGGEIRVTASDDGLNAAGGEKTQNASRGASRGFGMMSSTSGTLHMQGGYVVISCEGDGVDVNGDAEMTGGTMLVYGPESSMNGALDYDGIFNVSGGTLLAVGTSGMAQSVSGSDPVCVLAFTCRMPAETLMHIEDASAHPLLTFASPKSYSCVVFASDALNQGTTYNIYADGTYSADAVDGIYADGDYQNGSFLGSITL